MVLAPLLLWPRSPQRHAIHVSGIGDAGLRRDGYASVVSQVVQTYRTIGTDVRSAIVALQAKLCLDGVYRMQKLHDKYGSLEVSAADKFNNRALDSRVITHLHRAGSSCRHSSGCGWEDASFSKFLPDAPPCVTVFNAWPWRPKPSSLEESFLGVA